MSTVSNSSTDPRRPNKVHRFYFIKWFLLRDIVAREKENVPRPL